MSQQIAPYSAEQIADYFLVRNAGWGGYIDHLKLQKLCYYAQGFYTAWVRGIDPPLFREPLLAWPNGPVVRELHAKYNKDHASGPLPFPHGFNAEAIASLDRQVLDRVLGTLIEYPAIDLANATKLETPWIEANAKRKYADKGDEITLDALFTFFRKRLHKLGGEASAPPAEEDRERIRQQVGKGDAGD